MLGVSEKWLVLKVKACWVKQGWVKFGELGDKPKVMMNLPPILYMYKVSNSLAQVSLN